MRLRHSRHRWQRRCLSSFPPCSSSGVCCVHAAGCGSCRRRSVGKHGSIVCPAVVSSTLPAWSRPGLRRKFPVGRRHAAEAPPAMDATLEKCEELKQLVQSMQACTTALQVLWHDEELFISSLASLTTFILTSLGEKSSLGRIDFCA